MGRMHGLSHESKCVGTQKRSKTDFSYVAASYLFLPVVHHAGHFRPLLPVGWTLTFEFLFYLIFATVIALRIDALLRMLAFSSPSQPWRGCLPE
jgi:peptidoglycan/LPS O-acetylase OafA/YrhL